MGDGELKDWGLRTKKHHPGLSYFCAVCHFCQKWPTGMATCGLNEVVVLWGKAPKIRLRGRIRIRFCGESRLDELNHGKTHSGRWG